MNRIIILILLLSPFIGVTKNRTELNDSTVSTILNECGCIANGSALSKYLADRKERPKRVWLDFRTKELFFEDKYMKPKNAVQLIILHINPALYNIEINGTDTSNPFIGKSNVLGTIQNPLESGRILPEIIDKVGTVPLLDEAAKGIYTHALIAKLAATGVADMPDNNDKIKKILDAQVGKIATVYESIDKEQHKVGELGFQLDTTLAGVLKTYPDCKPAYRLSDSFVHSRYMKIRESFEPILATLRKQRMEYGIAILPYSAELKLADKSTYIDQTIRAFYDTATVQVGRLLMSVGVEKEKAMLAKIRDLGQMECCYKSLPQFFSKERKNIKLTISRRATEEDNKPSFKYETEFLLPRLPHTVSGIGTGFYADGLVNDNPVVVHARNVVGNDAYTIEEDQSNKVSTGISGLTYLGWRIGEQYSFLGIALGAGLSIEKAPKPRVMIGAAGVFGDTRRLIVSAGYTLGNVRRVSDAYKGKVFQTEPSGFTRDVLKGSFFFSLSYSILGQ